MPFTFSHPAIILPLTYFPKRWFSLTGLIIGSLTPDFEYFIRMRIESIHSHTVVGLFWFNIPLALILAFIYHNLIRDLLLKNLPYQLKTRLILFSQFDWNKYFKQHWHIVLISILIGTSSHVFWDSFTHHNGYFATLIPELKKNLILFDFELPVYKILQHSSSLLGGLCIVLAIKQLPKQEVRKAKPDLRYWGLLTTLTIILLTIRLYIGQNIHFNGHFIVSAISSGILALVFTSLIMKKTAK